MTCDGASARRRRQRLAVEAHRRVDAVVEDEEAARAGELEQALAARGREVGAGRVLARRLQRDELDLVAGEDALERVDVGALGVDGQRQHARAGRLQRRERCRRTSATRRPRRRRGSSSARATRSIAWRAPDVTRISSALVRVAGVAAELGEALAQLRQPLDLEVVGDRARVLARDLRRRSRRAPATGTARGPGSPSRARSRRRRAARAASRAASRRRRTAGAARACRAASRRRRRSPRAGRRLRTRHAAAHERPAPDGGRDVAELGEPAVHAHGGQVVDAGVGGQRARRRQLRAGRELAAVDERRDVVTSCCVIEVSPSRSRSNTSTCMTLTSWCVIVQWSYSRVNGGSVCRTHWKVHDRPLRSADRRRAPSAAARSHAVVIRRARDADLPLLHDLAELDSAQPLRGPVLVARRRRPPVGRARPRRRPRHRRPVPAERAGGRPAAPARRASCAPPGAPRRSARGCAGRRRARRVVTRVVGGARRARASRARVRHDERVQTTATEAVGPHSIAALELLSDVLAGVDEEHGSDEFFSRLAEAVCRLAQMDRAVIFSYDDARRRVHAAGAHGIALDGFTDGHVTVESAPVARQALTEDRVIEVLAERRPRHLRGLRRARRRPRARLRADRRRRPLDRRHPRRARARHVADRRAAARPAVDARQDARARVDARASRRTRPSARASSRSASTSRATSTTASCSGCSASRSRCPPSSR